MKALQPWEINAAELVLRISDYARMAEATAVSARAQAALTIRERLEWLERQLADMTRTVNRNSVMFDPARREIAFLAAALEVLDPGGACTQEALDDERIAREKAEP